MPDQESITLEIDLPQRAPAIQEANRAVESWEKGTVGAGEKMQKSLERMGEMLIKINDRVPQLHGAAYAVNRETGLGVTAKPESSALPSATASSASWPTNRA
jgi:hypothetical protein